MSTASALQVHYRGNWLGPVLGDFKGSFKGVFGENFEPKMRVKSPTIWVQFEPQTPAKAKAIKQVNQNSHSMTCIEIRIQGNKHDALKLIINTCLLSKRIQKHLYNTSNGLESPN